MTCRIFGSPLRLFVSLSTAILLSTGVASARQAAFVSSGVVADSEGGTIARAIVRLVDAQQHEVRATLTDDTGKFKIDTAGCAGCRVEASLPGFITASATPGSTALRLVLKPAPVRESVVVTATRDEIPGSQVGATTTVIDAAEIDRRGVPLVSELLRGVPGMTVVQSGGLGGVTSVFARAGESNYNKVLLDGIPLNEPGGTFNFSNLTTANLDRVEIVRGAQSALFGSDAMSSVIQLVTKRGLGAGSQPHGSASIEYGANNTARGGGEIRGESGRVDYSVHASGLGTDNRTANARFTNSTISWNSGVVIQPGMSFRTVGRTEWSRAGVPGPTAFGRPDMDAFFQRHDTAGGATLEHERGPFKGRLTYAYSTSNQISTNLTLDPPYTPALGTNVGFFAFSDFLYNTDNTLTRHRVSYQGDLRLGGLGRFASAQILTGLVDFDGERATLRDRLASTTVPASRNNTGVTLQYQAVSSRLSLVAGARVEDNASFGTVAVPRLSVSGLVRRGAGALGDTKLKFNAGLGIKEPTILQSFSQNAFFLGNPNLRAERARTIDIGVEQRVANDRVKVDVVWFDNRYRNQIATQTINFTTFASQYFNIGLTTARGLELAAETAIVPALHVKGGYTFTDSKIVDSTNAFSPVFAAGQPAFRRPRHAGFVQVAWAHKAVGLDLTGTLVGRRSDSDFFALGTPITSDEPYAIWTLGGHYRPTSRVDVFLRVENLFDKDYMEPLGYQAWRSTAHAGLRIGF